MSTWEERMSARAQERIAAERGRQRELERRRYAEYLHELEEATRPQREAGPPGGCTECYVWLRGTPSGAPCWWHSASAQPGPPPPLEPDGPSWLTPDLDESHWCWHACHGDEPVYCGPVAFAAAC